MIIVASAYDANRIDHGVLDLKPTTEVHDVAAHPELRAKRGDRDQTPRRDRSTWFVERKILLSLMNCPPIIHIRIATVMITI